MDESGISFDSNIKLNIQKHLNTNRISNQIPIFFFLTVSKMTILCYVLIKWWSMSPALLKTFKIGFIIAVYGSCRDSLSGLISSAQVLVRWCSVVSIVDLCPTCIRQTSSNKMPIYIPFWCYNYVALLQLCVPRVLITPFSFAGFII